MGSKSSKDAPIPESGFMRQDDDPRDLPAKLVIGPNSVICQAAKNPSGETVVALVTPGHVLARQLHVTSNTAFARVLRCGDGDGQKMEAPNKGMHMVTENFGKVDVVAIQFLKEKTRSNTCCCGCCSCCCCYYIDKPEDYGTVLVPKLLKGHLIVFFWPDDYIGDGYRNFPLKDVSPITVMDGTRTFHEIIPGCLLKSEDEAAYLRAIFKL